MQNMILGVDPGSTTGIAIVSRETLCYCKQVKKLEVIALILDMIKTYSIKKAAVEMPALGVLYDRPLMKKVSGIDALVSRGRISIGDYQRLMDTAPAQSSGLTAGQIKIAQNVGQNIEFTHTIIAALNALKVDVRKVTPRRKASKWAVNYWCRVFNWKETRVPGEHARDAACIAYLNGG
jgi:hypothetical protein